MREELLGLIAPLCIIVAPLSAHAAVPDELLETPLSAAFGAQPTIGHPMLSPDGSRLLFTQQDPLGVLMLLSLSLDDGAVELVLERIENGYDIHWCRFANETRLLCDLRKWDVRPESVAYHRFVAVNADGTAFREMPQAIGCRTIDTLRDQPMFDRVPDDPAQVLLLCPSSRPVEIDINRGRIRNVSGAGSVGDIRTNVRTERNGPFLSVIFDDNIRGGRGNLGIGQALYSNGHGLGNLYYGRQNNLDQWFVRNSARGGWRELLEIDPLAFESPFRPVGYGSDLNRVFNVAWDAEAQVWGLYRQDLSGDGGNERVFAHQAVDVELVDTLGREQRVVAAAFLEGQPRRAILDPRIAEVYEYVTALLPGLDVDIVDESWDRNLYLVRVRAPNRAGEFVLVDMENETVQSVGPEYAHLEEVELAETTLVQFESTTGGIVSGHLTLPHGADGPVPAVVMPRSRPDHENLADPHYLVQFLAASGYAVLRVNNRVEEEYGRGWLPERAIAGWQQSADDINDAASYLVERGITEPGLICGAGRNYGAYVALMSAIRHPELFSCIVSIAGVTDPREEPGGAVWTALGESNLLAAASPIHRPAELNAPTLLFHGWRDTDFSIQHSIGLAHRLEGEDKVVALIEYVLGNHEIRRAPYRIDMLTRIGGFLSEHIGPPLAEGESADEVFRWRP